jgi:hypothetical protein
VVFHGVSFGGLLAFKVCPVDHHSVDAVFEGENNGLGESCGERASTAVNSQSGSRSMDNHSVLVIEHENSHS